MVGGRMKKKSRTNNSARRKVSPIEFAYAAPNEPSIRNAFWCHVPRLSFEELHQFAEQYKVPVEYAWGGDVFGQMREFEPSRRIRASRLKTGDLPSSSASNSPRLVSKSSPRTGSDRVLL